MTNRSSGEQRHVQRHWGKILRESKAKLEDDRPSGRLWQHSRGEMRIEEVDRSELYFRGGIDSPRCD